MRKSSVLAAGLACFALTVPAAAADERQPKNQNESADKVVCKRFVETGSLVRSRKECRTEAEWARERALLRQGQAGVSSCRNSGQSGLC